MSRYLVTGAAGFIASRVAELLLDSGHIVVGVDNLNSAYDVVLKEWRLARLLSHGEFKFRRIDISERPAIESIFAEAPSFDGVINLAARAGVRQSLTNPWIYFDTNVTGTLNLLDLCHRYGVPKFILASSSSVYGNSSELPFREEAETDRPISPYAASKKAAEAICYTYHHLHGIDATVFRYFTVYGPAGRPDMSPFRFVQWIMEGKPVVVYGDGSQSRDFTYVDDIALGTIAGLKMLGHMVMNLGSDRPITVHELIRQIEEVTGKRAQIENHPANALDVAATWADIGRAKRFLGWIPRTSLRDGVVNMVTWYEANRAWARKVAV